MNEEEIDKKVIQLYKDSGISIDEILSSLKRLTKTAQWAYLNSIEGDK